MAQGWAESTWEITNYGRFINQFTPNIIRSICNSKGLTKKYVDKNVYYVQSNMYQCFILCRCLTVHINNHYESSNLWLGHKESQV